jgi:hypothetical protein
MDRIDVTEFVPGKRDKLSPAEKARREAVAAEIARTDFSVSAVFGGGLRKLFRAHKTGSGDEVETGRSS